MTADGGFVVAGTTSSYGAGGQDGWVLKFKPGAGDDVDVDWQKTYGGGAEDWIQDILETEDGKFVFAGGTQSFYSSSYRYSAAWLTKLDAAGSPEWQRVYGGDLGETANTIGQTSDGGFFLGGLSLLVGPRQGDGWLVRLNGTGGILWQKTYGNDKEEWIRSVGITSDGGVVAAGTTVSFGAETRSAWVMKLDSNGSIPGCPYVNTASSTARAVAVFVIATTAVSSELADSSSDSTAGMATPEGASDHQCVVEGPEITVAPPARSISVP